MLLATHAKILLETADKFLREDQFGVAIVLAHTACEVAVERVLSQHLQAKGLTDAILDAITGLFNGFSLANPKAMELYIALTGDPLKKATFWQRYQESSGRRNNVVHRGTIMTKADAEASIKVATEFVTHLKQL